MKSDFGGWKQEKETNSLNIAQVEYRWSKSNKFIL